ncbi:hypothetical protein F5879DRAFT_1044022 [Lentinula edodes]|nr:hypothetical protein F5879DRAFT_1044022 [Lentinula edodes]
MTDVMFDLLKMYLLFPLSLTLLHLRLFAALLVRRMGRWIPLECPIGVESQDGRMMTLSIEDDDKDELTGGMIVQRLLSDIWIARLARIPRYTNVALWELEKGNGKADHMSPEKEETTRVAENFFPEFWPARLNESLLGLIWSDEGGTGDLSRSLYQGKPLARFRGSKASTKFRCTTVRAACVAYKTKRNTVPNQPVPLLRQCIIRVLRLPSFPPPASGSGSN